MTLFDWQSIEIRKLDHGYMVIVATPTSITYSNTPDHRMALTTIEEVAAWLESQGIRCNPPGRKD